MPWSRNEPDPLDARRRLLAEQERLLAEQKKRLREMLHQPDAITGKKIIEPPVWRMEEDHTRARSTEVTPARKRHLARQRQRDMVLFFIFIGVFLVVLVIVLCAYYRNTAPAAGA
jgi:hypothetical protein